MALVAAVVVAAGQGLRAGGEIPKQFRRVGGQTLLEHALTSFVRTSKIALVQPVVRNEDLQLARTLIGNMEILAPVSGGTTRQASVRAGLEALQPHAPDIVLVHDAARPFTSSSLIARAIAAAEQTGAAIPALSVTDTVKRVDATGTIETTLDRNAIRLVQTPQAFRFPALLDAHRRAALEGRDDFTDDAALAEWAGMKVTVFEGEPGNIKLTTPEDFLRAESQQFAALGDVRTGSGLDVHAFGPGDHVTLGGIRIPHSHGLTGHSDADVALHALTDAILGAVGEGDIGQLFPDTDARWKGAPSHLFLSEAVERVRRKPAHVMNIDITIICEAPGIGPYRDSM